MSNDIRLYFKNTPRSSAIKINETIKGTPPKKRKSDLTKVSLPEGLIDDSDDNDSESPLTDTLKKELKAMVAVGPKKRAAAFSEEMRSGKTPKISKADASKVDVKPPKTDVKPPKADVKPPKADVKPPKADVKPPKADVKPPKADVKPPKADVIPPKPSKLKPEGRTIQWTEKYTPQCVNELIGQQGTSSAMNKLMKWMKDWQRNNLSEVQKKAKPSPFQAQFDGSTFKAALLSGPPGIGKTTSALLCCKSLGLSCVQMNASDARNKLEMSKHSEQLSSNQLEKYFLTTKEKKPSTDGDLIDHVLIMDEVDGMSGNADRAGIAELIQMIKRTRIPIICICNDRQSRKIRSLANHCFDLRFQRPRVEQIKGLLLTISTREKVVVTSEALDKIIEASRQDIRQCINTLQMLAGTDSKYFQQKDVTVNIFEAARRLLSTESNLLQKQELFFQDYSIMPLFVQENYPNVQSSRMRNPEHVSVMRSACECIAFGDVIDKCVRSASQWNLLVDQAMFSSVIPSLLMDGNVGGQIQFPSWFGRYSNAQKRYRLMRKLSLHSHLKTSGNSTAFVTDYLSLFREKMYRPLIRHENDGIKEVVELYDYYNLLREDAEAINELAVWPSSAPGGKPKEKDLASMVSSKTKAAFTRALNKKHRLLPYNQPGMLIKGKRGGKATLKGIVEDDDEAGVDEEEAEVAIDDEVLLMDGDI